MPNQDEQLEALLEAVLGSAKYSQVSPELARRIGAEELAKGRRLKEAVKNTKSKLHQVGGAYYPGGIDHQGWLAELREAEGEALKAACKRMIAAHASTRERVPILEDFYPAVLAEMPGIRSMLDIGCGLNPLALPWMGLAPDVEYHACDIYRDVVGFVDEAIKVLGHPGGAEMRDVIGAPPTQAVDAALVLKMIPCLEQVDKQAGERLLENLNARYIVVSFPAKSLGGREKGMLENYERRFEALAAGKDWGIKRMLFENELVFVVRK